LDWDTYVGLRTWRARRIGVSVVTDEVMRGESITVTMHCPRTVRGHLLVGLVCEERYDFATPAEYGTERTLATGYFPYEDWVEVDRSAGVEPLIFAIPPDTLFSYEGTCLCYAWRVRVEEATESRFRAWGELPIWVGA
jgi:hypothetical protein